MSCKCRPWQVPAEFPIVGHCASGAGGARIRGTKRQHLNVGMQHAEVSFSEHLGEGGERDSETEYLGARVRLCRQSLGILTTSGSWRGGARSDNCEKCSRKRTAAVIARIQTRQISVAGLAFCFCRLHPQPHPCFMCRHTLAIEQH